MPDGAQRRAAYLLYNTLIHVGFILMMPVWGLLRVLAGRYRGQFEERTGGAPMEVRRRFAGRRGLWVHAASAGEASSSVPLVQALTARFPERPVLFSVTSPYGKEMARRHMESVVQGIVYSPLDLPWFTARALRHTATDLYIMVESDLWPNMVRKMKRQGASVVVVSGQAGRRRFPRWFWRAVLGHVDLFLMQSEADARNIIGRGAPAGNVEVMGNLKYDSAPAPLTEDAAVQLGRSLGFPAGVPVLVAGSVLQEDEGPVLDAVVHLGRERSDLYAIIAPRRMERVEELLKGCRNRGLDPALRSRGESGRVVILDTMGELASMYNLARVAYVGGGFTPAVGLHNLIEPLVCRVPVIFGPHYGKAAGVAREIVRVGAGVRIEEGRDLAVAMEEILESRQRRAALSAAGAGLLAAHRGAVERHVARIEKLVGNR